MPFVSSYKTFWLGLGAIALDLLLALMVTSLLRNRLGHRSWRRVHWRAYACWPIGLAHGLGIGTDRASTLGVRADRGVRGGRGRRGNMAAGHRGPAGYPVTELALVTHRSPDLRLPRLLAGVSYYDVADLRDHEQQYGPLPLWGTSGRRRPGRLIDVVERLRPDRPGRRRVPHRAQDALGGVGTRLRRGGRQRRRGRAGQLQGPSAADPPAAPGA